jgi:hypothetical protein
MTGAKEIENTTNQSEALILRIAPNRIYLGDADQSEYLIRKLVSQIESTLAGRDTTTIWSRGRNVL